MKAGIQAGFGSSIVSSLPALKALGYEVVRIDLQDVYEPDQATALVQEVFDAGLTPFAIIRDAAQMRTIPVCPVDLGNEPDLTSSIAVYGPLASEASRAAHETGHALFVGSVSNLNQRGLQFLHDLGLVGFPSYVGCCPHRYPESSGNPQDAHKGFPNREAEVAALRATVGPRPLSIGEWGYHSQRRPCWCGSKRGLTPAEITANYRYEWTFWRRMFAGEPEAFSCCYQLNDPPPAYSQNNLDYGIRDIYGMWKPWAQPV